jgi:predicted polyphosphate/ATP-dependent NAD kinase
VNPIAGMGGRVALKGTDGRDALREARQRGAEPVAPERARRALARLDKATRVLAAPGVMGGDLAAGAGLAHETTAPLLGSATGPLDTRNAVAEMCRRGVELLLFAGGDGTARDILDAVGDAVPMLGIPSGVKMHSAVFAISPEAAGQLAALVATDRGGKIGTREAEIMDIDEEAMRTGRVSARLHGYGRVPFERHLVQSAKAGGIAEDAALDGVCREIAAEMRPGVVYILGPGTTTRRILGHLGLAGTLLGVDAVRDGKIVGRDLGGEQVAELVRGQPAQIIVSVIGGQGYIFGRGNQQIGPAVIRAVGCDNLIVVATQRKLASLEGGRLLVDSGDRALDEQLQGYIRVRTGPGQSAMMRLAA